MSDEQTENSTKSDSDKDSEAQKSGASQNGEPAPTDETNTDTETKPKEDAKTAAPDVEAEESGESIPKKEKKKQPGDEADEDREDPLPGSPQDIKFRNNHGTFNANHYYGDQRGEGRRSKLPDPTKELTPLTPRRPLLPPEELDRLCARLCERRLILLDCALPEILDHLAGSILTHERLKGVRPRHFQGGDSDSAKYEPGWFLSGEEPIGSGGEVAVVLSLTDSAFLEFLERYRSHEDTIQMQLRNRGAMLICQIKYPLARKVRRFESYRLDYLPSLLAEHYATVESSQLAAELRLQRREGKWGPPDEDEDEFYDQIMKLLATGAEALRAEIGARRRGEPAAESTPAVRSLAELDKLDQAILFVAAFMPRLTWQEFETALKLVLGEETMEVEKIVEESAPSSRPGREPRWVKKKVTETVRLTDLWAKERDKRMRGCGLTLAAAPGGRKRVRFSSAGRRTLERAFEEELPTYTLDQLRKIQASGWYFEEGISTPLQENLLKIYSRIATFDPDAYGKEWLSGIVGGLSRQLNLLRENSEKQKEEEMRDRIEQGIASAEDMTDLFRIVFHHDQGLGKLESHVIRHVFGRLQRACRRMLEEPLLRPSVTEFFEELLDCENFGAILEIGTPLRFAPEFSITEWLKRIFNYRDGQRLRARWNPESTSMRARGVALDWVNRELDGSPANGLAFYERLQEWLPPRDRKPEECSAAECCALTLPVRYLDELAWRRSQPPKGTAIQTECPLFEIPAQSEPAQTEAALQTRLETLAQRLTHPCLGWAAQQIWLENSFRRLLDGNRRSSFVASLHFEGEERPDIDDLGAWAKVVRDIANFHEPEGFAVVNIGSALRAWTWAVFPREGSPPPEDQARWEFLLRRVAELTLAQNRKLPALIEKFWAEQITDLLGAINTLPPGADSMKQRREWQQMRERLMALRTEFQRARSVAAQS